MSEVIFTATPKTPFWKSTEQDFSTYPQQECCAHEDSAIKGKKRLKAML